MMERRNQGVYALERAIGKNRLDYEDAKDMLAHAPGLANLLCEGLTAAGTFGEVDANTLLQFATQGVIRTEHIDAALGR